MTNIIIWIIAISVILTSLYFLVKWLVEARELSWAHWVWAFPVYFIGTVGGLLAWMLGGIKYIGPVPNTPTYTIAFQTRDWVTHIWDLIPDNKVGGETIGGASLGVFILLLRPEGMNIIRHECRHNYQIFRWGLLFPFMYAYGWIKNSIKYKSIQRGYFENIFEVKARQFGKLPFRDW